MAMRVDPIHPPGFWKVHGYVEEWFGLWTRGCIKKWLRLDVSIDLLKKCPTLSTFVLFIVLKHFPFRYAISKWSHCVRTM